MSIKFNTGDRVWLLTFEYDDHVGEDWSRTLAPVVGCVGTIVRYRGVLKGHDLWLVEVDGAGYNWPEDYLRLEEHPTIRNMKAVKVPAEKPQWMVSRDACLEPGNCACGCPREQCSYHRTGPAMPSIGEGFAKAWAGYKPTGSP